MTFARKLSKLQRDPQAFFNDAKHPLARQIGSWIVAPTVAPPVAPPRAVRPAAAPAGQAKNSPAPRAGKAAPAAASKKSALDVARSLEAVFGCAATANDLWFAYRSSPGLKATAQTPVGRAVIYPLGVWALDQARVSAYARAGWAAECLPLWEVMSHDLDMEDLEFQATKDPVHADDLAHRLLRQISAAGAATLVLPYDATALTRALAIRARALGMPTVCHLPANRAVFGLYDGPMGTSMPICDHLVVDEALIHAGASHPQWLAQGRRWCAPHVERSSDRAMDGEALRARLGVGPSEALCVLALPPRQYSLRNDQMAALVEVQVAEALKSLEPTDHLVILSRRKKQGFLGAASLKALALKYRKSVLHYHDDLDLAAVLSLARQAWLPQEFGALAHGSPCTTQVYAVAESDRSSDAASPGLGALEALESLAALVRSTAAPELPWGIAAGVFERPLARIFDADGPGLDVIAVPDPITNVPITEGRQKHLLALLHAQRRLFGAGSLQAANVAELFIQWGAEPSESKERPEALRSVFGRPRLFLEDGFIRSRGMWTDPNEPTLSVVMDTRAIYYNALQPSLLESILNSAFELDAGQSARARSLIDDIVRHKVSKYNHAPIIDLDFRSPGKRTLLIVDQKAGDMSIKYGAASDDTFAQMLQCALDLGDEVEIVIKQHPCAISGGAHEAHYTAASLGSVARQQNVHLIGFDVNPYCLINAVDEVWTVSSGMGFEALMAGKQVRCFGLPFYANWGVTADELRTPRRQRFRSMEDLFYVFYILLSRYVDPDSGKACEVERLVEYFAKSATPA